VTAAADVRLDRGELSARGYGRVLRIAWSVSDLAGQVRPSTTDVEEALACAHTGARVAVGPGAVGAGRGARTVPYDYRLFM
jgi:Magnesium chelatase, subunit ChlI C-terminal